MWMSMLVEGVDTLCMDYVSGELINGFKNGAG